MSAANELLIKLKTIAELGGFDSLEGKVKKAATDMKGMENTTNAAAKKMKTDLEQVNNTNFSSLNNKFTSTIRSMVSTSASGAKAIGQNLSSMTDGIDGAITSVAAGMGVMELFEKSMGKSLTSTQLHNAKPGDYQSIMDQYMKFTTASSASDDDINKMLRYTYSGNSSSTYKAINAVDAISYNADKLQRQEGIRGWGTYLSGGWSAASGMMRDEPLTADQVKLLQNAKTYDQRIAAMETIAKQKGNMDSSGNSLSTTTDGTLGKYNKTLAFADSIMRGATSTFETFMTTIDPIITGFNNLDPGIKDVIGGTLTWGILLTAGAAGLGILSKVLSPVGSVLSTGVGKLKDALSGAKDVKDKVSGLKDALDSKKLVSTVNIKAATVNVNGKTTGTNSTTPTKTGQNTPTPVSAGSRFLSGLSLAGILSGSTAANAAALGTAGILGVGTAGTILAGTTGYGLNKADEYMNSISPGIGKTWGGMKAIGGVINPFGTQMLSSMQSGAQVFQDVWNGKNPLDNLMKGVTTNHNWGIMGAAGQGASDMGAWANDNIGKPISDWWNSWSLEGVGSGIDKWFNTATPSKDIADWAGKNIGTPVTDAWNNAKTTVMSNPVLGSAITEVSNLFNDPKKFWSDARSYVSHSIVGKAWADAVNLYNNVKYWWDRARSYVSSRQIVASQNMSGVSSVGSGTGSSNNGKNGASAGDEGADAGYGTGPYYEPIITTPSTITTTKKVTIAPVIKIDKIDSKETADYFGNKMTQVLSELNDAYGN